MLSTRNSVFAIALLIGQTSPSVLQAVTLNTDTVLGPGHPYQNETITIVDGDSPPTIVQVIDGAIIGGPPTQLPVSIGMDLFDQSIVEVLGGFIRGLESPILLHDQSQLRMSSGETRDSPIELRDSSRAFFHGGLYGAFRAYGSSHVEVYGGDGGGRAFENARIDQYSGNLMDVLLRDQSSFVMHGGFLDEGFQTFGESRALINGGSISGLVRMLLNDQSIVTVRGGGLFGELEVNDEALLHVYGFGLEFVFEDDEHFVQGTLADGGQAHLEYRLSDQDQIILHEVPEPATWGMLAVGCAGIAAAGWSRTRATKSRRIACD